jgi:hypothetical protein
MTGRSAIKRRDATTMSNDTKPNRTEKRIPIDDGDAVDVRIEDGDVVVDVEQSPFVVAAEAAFSDSLIKVVDGDNTSAYVDVEPREKYGLGRFSEMDDDGYRVTGIHHGDEWHGSEDVERIRIWFRHDDTEAFADGMVTRTYNDES